MAPSLYGLHGSNMILRHMRILFSVLIGILLFDAASRSYALDVVIKVIVTREGMPWVLGTTNLPDGSILLVSLIRHEAKYSAKILQWCQIVVSLQDRSLKKAAPFHLEITKLKSSLGLQRVNRNLSKRSLGKITRSLPAVWSPRALSALRRAKL